MVVRSLLKHAPVIGSVYGFATTAMKVSNCTTPSGAIITAAKGIVIDPIPPVVKYQFCLRHWRLVKLQRLPLVIC